MFAGVLHLDGAPGAVHELVCAGVAPAGGWDQDGGYAEGPLAFRWQYRWTTPESVDERQPLICHDRRFVVSYSGRIDNRDELIGRYRLAADAGDGALLAAALSRDGAAGLRYCVGDFVVAAWDRVERRLWLARDAIGHRPLFYARDRERVMWSTDIRVLRAGPARDARPNAGFLAEYLSGLLVSQDETAFDLIRRVPPAHALSMAPGDSSFASTQYWMPPQSLPPRRGDRELIEEFTERFTTAVRASLRARGSVAAELSGGLDSSSIVALTSELAGTAPDTYSVVFPGSTRAPDGERLDESEFIDTMVAAVHARSFRHDPRATGCDDVLRVMREHGDLPDWPNADLVRWPMARAAAADGHRVLLTGLGGDQWLTGTVARLPALVRAGHFGDAWRFARDAVGQEGLEAEWRPMLRRVAAAALPESVKRTIRALNPARPWPSWVRDSFAADVDLAARLRAAPGYPLSDRDPVLRDALAQLVSAEGLLAREALFRSTDDAGVDARHPFFDRRLVEFVITLPDDLRFRNGRTRHILREAMGTRLPATIAARTDKGDSTLLLAHAVRAAIAGVSLDQLRVADLGWVDGGWMRAACAELSESAATRVPGPRDLYVWSAVAVEVWLRSVEGGT